MCMLSSVAVVVAATIVCFVMRSPVCALSLSLSCYRILLCVRYVWQSEWVSECDWVERRSQRWMSENVRVHTQDSSIKYTNLFIYSRIESNPLKGKTEWNRGKFLHSTQTWASIGSCSKQIASASATHTVNFSPSKHTPHRTRSTLNEMRERECVSGVNECERAGEDGENKGCF